MHHEIVVSFVKAQTDLWRPLRLSEKLFATRGSFLTLYDALCAFSQMETLVRAARCFTTNLHCILMGFGEQNKSKNR